MGQNAFFVETGVRGAHSLVTDTCANCHMVQTPPPAVLSYNLGGTNHTFYASKDVCANCHSEITADTVQAANIAQRPFLQTSLEGALEAQLNAQLAAGNDVTFVGTDVDGVEQTVTVTAASGSTFVVTNYADSHGRQAADLTVDDGVAPVAYTHAQIRNIDVSDGVNTAQLLSYGSVVQTIAEAGWNFLMATNERSDGVHNPTFSGQIIAGAQNVLDNMDATVVEVVPAP
jgi:hypothetical protein